MAALRRKQLSVTGTRPPLDEATRRDAPCVLILVATSHRATVPARRRGDGPARKDEIATRRAFSFTLPISGPLDRAPHSRYVARGQGAVLPRRDHPLIPATPKSTVALGRGERLAKKGKQRKGTGSRGNGNLQKRKGRASLCERPRRRVQRQPSSGAIELRLCLFRESGERPAKRLAPLVSQTRLGLPSPLYLSLRFSPVTFPLSLSLSLARFFSFRLALRGQRVKVRTIAEQSKWRRRSLPMPLPSEPSYRSGLPLKASLS